MHGFVSEERKLELLQRSWVHLTASSAEGWCLTVMEAAACETPSVALDVGGLPESVEHEVTGLLAHDGDELGRHTRRLVEDDELRARMGPRRARAGPRLHLAAHGGAVAGGPRGRAGASAEPRAPARPPGLLRHGPGRRPGGRADGEQLHRAGLHRRVRAPARRVRLRLARARCWPPSRSWSCPGSALQATAAREVSGAAATGDSRIPAAEVRRWLERIGLLVAGSLAAAA